MAKSQTSAPPETTVEGLPDSSSEHYDESYFDWQRSAGAFGGWADQTKFRDFIRPSDRVIDFGCGGGFLLRNLECADRIGIEPNPAARAHAEQLGLRMYAETRPVPAGWADVVISHHALEHTLDPLGEVRQLRERLCPGGTAVVVVPCEAVGQRWAPDDINHHLFSWSPMCLGNLFTEAGYEVQQSEPYMHKWPPAIGSMTVRIGGRRLFDATCKAWSNVSRSLGQVRVVAHRPLEG